MKHLDLFSGIGGFALAARWAGIETVAFCEIEDFPRKVLEKNFPGVPIHRDIRDLDGREYAGIDLITGGYPCQPFSVAGKRKGQEDDRHLWPEMRRVITQARPTWVVCENVTGHITLGLDQVLTELETEGYSARAFVVPACAIGANHRRDRVWIIAHATGDRQQGNERGVTPQKQNHRPPQALGARHWGSGAFTNWEKLMGESELCRVDDGVSSTVDIRPRLHAYGNAIVPQVAYEILRAISAH